jgi:hypothetical protein
MPSPCAEPGAFPTIGHQEKAQAQNDKRIIAGGGELAWRRLQSKCE